MLCISNYSFPNLESFSENLFLKFPRASLGPPNAFQPTGCVRSLQNKNWEREGEREKGKKGGGSNIREKLKKKMYYLYMVYAM